MSETEKEPPLPQSVPCTECAAGMMHPRLIAYFTWLGNELITVPNFPAWVCDVCGKREYDEQAISWMNMLLNPNAGRPTHSNRKAPHTQPRSSSARPASES